MSAHAATNAAFHKPDTPTDQDTAAAPQRDAGGVVSSCRTVSRTLKNAVNHWLDWQCRMIAGVHSGAVYVPVDDPEQAMEAISNWPAGIAQSPVMDGFAAQAFRVGRSVLHKAADDRAANKEVRDFVAHPVCVDGKTIGVIALALEIRSEVQRQAVVQVLEWGEVWLEKTLQGVDCDRREDSRLALRVVRMLSADAPFAVSSRRVCDVLADAFGCSRVAMGVLHGMQMRVVAMSGQTQFDRRVARVTTVQSAMEECVDQEELICYPDRFGHSRGLTRAHSRLLEMPESAAACSVPVMTDEHVVGALTLIWSSPDQSDSSVAARIGDIVTQIAPVIELRERAGHSLWRRGKRAARILVATLLGAGHLKAKLLTALFSIALLSAHLVQTDRRVAADSVIEGTMQQAVVAPVDGYLLAAHARAGDVVEQGQKLAAIDERELLLEQQKWQSERDKHVKEYQEALAVRDRAKISIASARIAQADAELGLVADQLERTQLVAPFSGTLVSGDLSRALGAPVERGQLLFQIVPDEGYRVGLQVDEHNIAGLSVGQGGELRLAGLPHQPITFEIVRIVPLATADQSGNRFRVEAELNEVPEGLRPGMHGVAKVVTGRTSLLHAWTDDLLNRVKYWLWSLGL